MHDIIRKAEMRKRSGVDLEGIMKNSRYVFMEDLFVNMLLPSKEDRKEKIFILVVIDESTPNIDLEEDTMEFKVHSIYRDTRHKKLEMLNKELSTSGESVYIINSAQSVVDAFMTLRENFKVWRV